MTKFRMEQAVRSSGPRPWTGARVALGIRKYGVPAVADCVAVFLAFFLAWGFRTGAQLDVYDPAVPALLAVTAGIAQVAANILFRVYWRDWGVAALEDLIALAKSTGLVVVALIVVDVMSESHYIPFGAVFSGGGLALVFESALKLRPRWRQIARAAVGRSTAAESVVIIGAGRMGQLLARDISDGSRNLRIACFVDDDPSRWGTYVRGIRVAGAIGDLRELIERYGPSIVVISIVSAGGELVRQIVDLCEGTDVQIRAVSGFSWRDDERAPLRTINIEELLQRDPVALDTPEARAYLGDRTVLVTGAAGSIGSELCRQIAELGPRRLVVLDMNESGLYEIESRLGRSVEIDMLLGDVRDRAWLRHVFDRVRPDVVFHAAAYKHVPIVEHSPLAGIATNVIGTSNVIEAAAAVGVGHFVLISSDKAVAPSSVMGMTKRFGELLTTAYAIDRHRAYAAVRFGNVLGSVGSIVPLFTRQIEEGGPLTVTHPEATRFFMTVNEAVSLVIEAGAIAQPGDLLVLDMGAPISIHELAQKMVRLRGLRVPKDIDITFTGLRPGEKLHEELFQHDEVAMGTRHPLVRRVAAGDQSPSLASLITIVRRLEEHVASYDALSAIETLESAMRPAFDASRATARP